MRAFAWASSAVREAVRKHHTPREVGTAVGTGVFIGCTPFFGFHSLIAAGVSWLCGLNFIYVWLGTEVSNPLFAAFLTATSIGVGAFIIGRAPSAPTHWLVEWLIGSLVVGCVLGSSAGIATAIALKRLHRTLNARKESTR